MAIELACRDGHLEIVRLLLADGRVNPADQNNKAIELACNYGRLEIVRLLLADGRVNPADQNNKAIEEAFKHGYVEIVRLLLADQRVNPISCFQIAVRRGVHWIREHEPLITLLEQDLRIAMFANDEEAIRRFVDLNPRPPRNSLVYTLGNRDSRILLNKLYTDKATIRKKEKKHKKATIKKKESIK